MSWRIMWPQWEKKREVYVIAHFWEVRGRPHPPLICPSLLVQLGCCLKDTRIVPLQSNLNKEHFTAASYAEQKCEIWITVQLPDHILCSIYESTNCLAVFNKKSLCTSSAGHETSKWWLNVIMCYKKKKRSRIYWFVVVKEVNDIWGNGGIISGFIPTLTIITNVTLWLVLFETNVALKKTYNLCLVSSGQS